ncbi:Hsp20/alpha crystallin family protein [Halomicroarcula sp. F13]|uniref:Hsp20/alpha crystallin family protein n=1 Tax=Haloarcula rubra TaxID=2487747 RepID=A0AAW4PNW9_9EURY|nr:Hsp20/alpha crystallin family protein [Halomicroarcula rubra]MBX0323318.1 Hsp20/alpha crystallin family protein [Halomicroarcula rubra]
MARKLPLDNMESWFEQMSRQFEAAAERWGTGFEPWTPEMESPRVDVVDENDAYVVTADLPGFGKDDLDVYISDQTLAIEADHSHEAEETEVNYVRRERSHRSLSRRVRLPGSVDEDDVSASMDDGVLTVRIGKADAISGGHQIDIE